MHKKILLVLLLCLFPLNVRALKLECPSVVAIDEEFSVELDDSSYIGVTGHFASGDVFTYLGGNFNNGWKKYYFGDKGFSASSIIDYKNLAGSLNFRVGHNVSFGLHQLIYDNVEAVTDEYQNVSVGTLSCDIIVASNDNSLKSLKIDGKESINKFSKDYVYKFETYNDSIDIEAVANDGSAKVDGNLGKQNLSIGANVINIRVVSARGVERYYKLFVTRLVKVTRTDDKKNSSGKSSDVSLKSLLVGKVKISLENNKFIYNVDVDNDITHVDVVAEANNSNTKVVIENVDTLIVGDNYLNIIVTAEDGTVAKYMVNVKRNRVLSGDNKIKNIIIKDYDLAFSPDAYNYVLDVEGAHKLDIQVILSDLNAKYVINGNNNLRDGSIIDIVVTAENGDECSYKIKIQSNVSHSVLDYVNIYYLLGFIGLIFIVLAIKVMKDRVNNEK